MSINSMYVLDKKWRPEDDTVDILCSTALLNVRRRRKRRKNPRKGVEALSLQLRAIFPSTRTCAHIGTTFKMSTISFNTESLVQQFSTLRPRKERSL